MHKTLKTGNKVKKLDIFKIKTERKIKSENENKKSKPKCQCNLLKGTAALLTK